MAASTFRQQLRAGCFSVLSTYQVANPSQLAHVYDHRPAKYMTPLGFVDNIVTETMVHDSGTRTRTLTARVLLVNKLISNDQAADEQDTLTDGVVDAFTAAPRAASSSSLIEPVGVEADTLEWDGALYAASVILVRGIEQVGRL